MSDVNGRLAGVRVLRSLGPGERCSLLLGHLAEPEGPGRLLVLKRVPGADAIEEASRELVALDRAAGAHVVQALDLSVVDGEAILLLEHVAGPSLSVVAAGRAAWAAGEVVTIVAPLAETLRRLQAAGVAHGAVDARHILFSGTGSPTLVGFGAADTFPPGSAAERLSGLPVVVRDRQGIRQLACSLLAQVSEPHRAAAAALAEELAALDDEQILAACAERLFGLAPAAAVDLDPRSEQGQNRVGALIPAAADPAQSTAPPPAVGLLAGLLPDEWAARIGELRPGRLRSLLEERGPAGVGGIARTAAARRGPLLVGLGIVVVAVAFAIGIPGGDPPRAAEEPLAVELPIVEPAVREPSAVRDDPVQAAVDLVAAREQCFRELSLLCLEHVDQAGSVALESDRRSVEARRSGSVDGGLLLEASPTESYELVERMGGSALVRTGADSTGPTLLLIHGDSGWRIREIIPDDGGAEAAP